LLNSNETIVGLVSLLNMYETEIRVLYPPRFMSCTWKRLLLLDPLHGIAPPAPSTKSWDPKSYPTHRTNPYSLTSKERGNEQTEKKTDWKKSKLDGERMCARGSRGTTNERKPNRDKKEVFVCKPNSHIQFRLKCEK
jgi:hypothetical protein